MDNERKVTALIVKLNKLTQEGELKWETKNYEIQLGSTEELLNKVYQTKLKNKEIRIFRYRYKYYTDEHVYHWASDCRLEFIDSDGTPEWTFPEESTIYDLYDSVRYQTAQIDNFLDNFLTDEDLNTNTKGW